MFQSLNFLRNYAASAKRVFSKSQTKIIKDTLGIPQRGLSPYIEFYRSKYASVAASSGDKVSVSSIAKTIAAEWKGLSEDEKKIYCEKSQNSKKEAAAKMEKYSKEMNENKKTLLNLFLLQKKSGISKEERDFLDKLPAKPYSSGRTMFIAQRCKKDSISLKDAAKEYQLLDDAAKKRFENEAKKDQERYAKELLAFISSA